MQEVQVPLPVGSVLRGQYLIERLLGKGCSSAVYLVSDQRSRHSLSHQFALKEVIAPSKGERDRLIFEGVLLRWLRHQGFPRIYHVFNNGNYDRMYLLMEYIEGTSLEALRQQRPDKRFSWLEAIPLMAPVIDAVEYLHAQQPLLLHRDIKPTNIIVSEARTVLVDFGLIEAYDPDLPSAVVRSRSSAYRAPEQYNGGMDTRTDVYGLGATFYTLVTSMVPVDALSRMAQIDNGELDPLKPVNEVIPSVPAHVAEVIDRAMSVHAHERFSSVERFWEALWESVNVLPVELPSAIPAATPSVAPRRSAIYGSVPTVESSVAAFMQKGPRVKRLPFFVTGRLGVLILLARVERLWEALRSPMRRRAPLSGGMPSATLHRPDTFEPVSVVARPATTGVLDHQPRAPRARKQGALWLFARKRTGEQPATVAPLKRSRTPHAWMPGIALVLLTLLVGLGAIAGFSSRVPNHVAIPQPTVTVSASRSTRVPAPVSITSSLTAGTYAGTIDDLSSNMSTYFSLTGVRQSQRTISGYVILGSTGQWSAPFSGTIDSKKHLQFTVTDAAGRATLFFQGVMQSATSLSGDYYQCRPTPAQNGLCSRAPGGYGIWSVVLMP